MKINSLLFLFAIVYMSACSSGNNDVIIPPAKPNLKFTLSTSTFNWAGSLTTNNTVGSKITKTNLPQSEYELYSHTGNGVEKIYLRINTNGNLFAVGTFDCYTSVTTYYPFGTNGPLLPTFETYNLTKSRITITKFTNGLASGSFTGPVEYRGPTGNGIPRNLSLSNGEFEDISVLQ